MTDEWLTIGEMVALFHLSAATIRARAARGDFVYEVRPNGRYYFRRDTVLTHIDELTRRNNYGPNLDRKRQGNDAPRSPRKSRPYRPH